jgi:hypothetical protein
LNNPVLGLINDNGTWRIRCNKEIYTLYGDPELSTIEKITMGLACAKNGESKYTQDSDGWSFVWKTSSREA